MSSSASSHSVCHRFERPAVGSWCIPIPGCCCWFSTSLTGYTTFPFASVFHAFPVVPHPSSRNISDCSASYAVTPSCGPTSRIKPFNLLRVLLAHAVFLTTAVSTAHYYSHTGQLFNATSLCYLDKIAGFSSPSLLAVFRTRVYQQRHADAVQHLRAIRFRVQQLCSC